MNEKHQFIAQVCHIEAAAPDGQRYNPAMTEEQRRSYDNLLLLCYRHHIETNDPGEFTVELLKQMKAQHEAQFRERLFMPPEEVVEIVAQEAESFWREVAERNLNQSVFPSDIRMEIDVSAKADKLFNQIRSELRWLASAVVTLRNSHDTLEKDVQETLQRLGYDLVPWVSLPDCENPAANRDWELLTHGLSNLQAKLRFLLDQVEIRHLESAIQSNPEAKEIRARLDALRTHMLGYAAEIGYSD